MKQLFSVNKVAGLLARWAVAAAVIGLTTVSPACAETEGAATWRQHVAISVALAPGQPTNYVVRGELDATDDELLPGTTVQLLINAATCNHDYWDFGRMDGITYSYARDVAARGFPTFALDMLGSASNSHPLSDQLTSQAEAYVAHQIVQGLRDGSITGVQFSKVITVGDSLGSLVVWQEAITYADVDGLIVTGVTHSLSRFQEVAKTDFYPAVDDPKFAGSRPDAGYLTTVPGMCARIQVPVLAIVGSNDAPTCGPNPQGGNFVVMVSGHEFSLAVNRELQVVAAVAWSSAFVGQFRFGERRDLDNLDGSESFFSWSDALPWNCGTISTEAEY
jgi:pimeloyl-ACP methyl ester carboxylesterase